MDIESHSDVERDIGGCGERERERALNFIKKIKLRETKRTEEAFTYKVKKYLPNAIHKRPAAFQGFQFTDQRTV